MSQGTQELMTCVILHEIGALTQRLDFNHICSIGVIVYGSCMVDMQDFEQGDVSLNPTEGLDVANFT